MSTTTRQDLPALVNQPHDRALAALQDGAVDPLAALAWCCTHLAATDGVLYPSVQRHVPDGRRRVHEARADDHLLQQTLCRLERRLTGAVRHDTLPVSALLHEARVALRVHVENEAEMLELLVPLLEQDEQQQLATRLTAATAAGPTRPHPHTRHTPLSPLLARIDAAVDRVRDVMDNRQALAGRPPRPALTPGRWACYAMGMPYPPAERPARQR